MTKINPKFLEIKHKLKKGYFHKKMKPKILKYANKYCSAKELSQIGKNPDIALDKNNIVYLISVKNNGKPINLKVHISFFI